ncbi:ATP-grasp domain-containing protein [Streptomyces sp. VNUA116]|uniref:ATP-grasp domain-containing protein n=1 Tax=Streptomyces sp. VNUA116 TaxID=3062449 RepID=UPI0026775D09|nr:ATP-grasp domain-containing protein [Streptomyces sp. VNUA116]WKU43001.1 ATP-grasp domain-containing protein [Streptomyces sp. VNUA116]
MITSLDDAYDALRGTGWLSFTPRPFLFLPLLRTRILSVLVSGQRMDPGWASRFGVECLSAEELTRMRDEAGGRSDLEHLLPRAGDLLSRRWRGHRLALASYGQWWPEWRAALAGSGLHVQPPPAGPLPDVLTDKTCMRPWLRSLHVRTPADTVTARLDHVSLRRRFGSPYVVQQPRGTGGHGTHLVRDEQDLGRIPPGGPWLVSRCADGVPVNHHGLVGSDGTVCVLPASVQFTDLRDTGVPFGTYAGCDFGAVGMLPAAGRDGARRAVERIGHGLAHVGYRGTFGVDLLVTGDDVLVLEVNCRMQSSTWLLGELELAAGLLPTQLRHVLEQHGHGTAGEYLPEAAGAVQLMLRHSGPPARVNGVPRSGRYAISGPGDFVRRGEGYGLLECGADEIVLLHLPRPATVLASGAALARLISRRPLTTPDGRALTARGRQAVSAATSLFALEPVAP